MDKTCVLKHKNTYQIKFCLNTDDDGDDDFKSYW